MITRKWGSKKHKIMKTKLLLLIFFICFGALQAQDFTVNTVNYTVIDATNNYVTVARNAGFVGDLTLPSTVDFTENGSTTTYTVTKINAQAFQSTSITSITIPNSVTELGAQAFSYCNVLTSITLPNSITTIPEQFLRSSKSLESITIPNSVTSIEDSAFFECSKLKTITLSNTLEDIGVYTFSETNIESIDLPNTLTTLGRFAFTSCTNLKSIVIPNSVTDMGNNTFQYCSSLANITIPNAIVRTGANTFEGTAIKNITLPNSLTRIDNYAFKGCTELENVIIPPTSALSSIGVAVFENCAKLESIELPEAITQLETYLFRGSGLTSFTIAQNITTLGVGVFQNCKNLTSFTFPEHLTEVPQTILKGCSNLTNVTIPDHYTAISSSAFEACTSLESITLPSSLSGSGLGSSLFRYCNSLKQVNIPAGVTRIPAYLFGSCTSLENIILPNNVTTINNNAFDGCTSLKNINFPNTLTTFQSQVFRNCTNLTNISLPLNLGIVGNSSFEGCTELSQLNIESNVTNLGNNTFKGCTNLSKVSVKWQNPLAISATVFEDLAIENVELKIPNNTTSLYQNTAVWQDFGTFTEDDFVPNESLVVNGSAEITPILENGWTQVSGNWTGTTSSTAQDGNNFFFAGANSSAELYQDIDVSSFTADIDAGVQKFYFSVHLKSFNSFPFDKSQVVLEYRDSQDNILTTYDTEPSENTTWFQYEDTRVAPVDTKTVRIKLFSFRVNGSNNDGYIDNVVFRNEGLDVVEIPDSNFEQYLIDEAIDTDALLNGQVFRKDLTIVENLDVRSKNISDLTGIEAFSSLKTLNATNNSLSTIDVTNNQLLESLYISQNQLTNIDISKNVNLKNVNLADNQITSLNLTTNINLESLNFRDNTIATVDFSKNIKLKELYIDNSELQSLDVSMLQELETLWCFNNEISDLNITNNLKLTSLDCSDNKITALNVDNNIALQQLFCSRNQLTTLQVDKNTALTEIVCEQNAIIYLDLSKNEFLTKILCNDNALVGLNVQNGNNSNIQNSDFSAFANPNLTCILVDENFTGTWAQIDMQTEIRTDCPELVAISNTNFEAYLESINAGNGIAGDGYVFKEPIETLTSLSIASKNINDISGIEYFTSLTYLDVADNGLTQIDLTKNILLETFLADFNLFTSFNFTQNTKLKTIEARSNLLTTIDLSTLIDLERLELESNQLTTLALESNPKISILDLKNNQFENLDLSNLTELVIFEANNNLLRFINLKNTANPSVSTLDTTKNPNLTCIEVLNVDYFNNIAPSIDIQTKFYENCPSTTTIPDNNFEAYLESINVGNGIVGDNLVLTQEIEKLTNLNIESKNITDLTGVSSFTNLIDLNVKDNNITEVDISQNKQLEVINLENNELLNVDFSKNFSLKSVNVGDNQISNLDVYFLTELETLQCYKNQITTINLVSNTKLLAFVANENQLQIVDVRANTNLVWLDVDDNDLVSLTIKNDNNTKITQFSATGNANLTCIEVDEVSYSETNWLQKDATANFSADCAPANDDCSFAIPLVFGQETPGDINSGTFTNATDCVSGPIIADVWYIITVPETGEFSIEGGGFGGLLKFAIYESCASASSISCGLNLSLTNLTPGDVYYLKVWMEGEITNKSVATNQVTGTFTLTANESSVLSIDGFNLENIRLMLFPNPAKENVTISLANNMDIEQAEVYNVLGEKLIIQKRTNTSKVTLDVSNLPTGIYFIKAKTSKGILSEKLIIK